MRHIPLAALLLSVLSTAASAVQIADLYQGRAPATGAPEALQTQALGQVLTKLTGQRELLAKPEIQGAIGKVTDYVRRYEYQGEGAEKQMRVEFEPSRVNQLATRSQLAILGSSRPQIAVWLVIDDSLRRMVGDQSQDGWAQELKESGGELALPLVLPIMDLDDNSAVSVTDVLGRFIEPVARASARYGAEMVLLGRLTAQDETWTLEWNLYGSRDGQQSELSKGSFSGGQAEVSEQLTGELARWLVAHYGVKVGGERQSIQLQVDGLGDLGDMAKVQSLLRGMANVAAVEVASIEGESVVLRVDFFGTAEQLGKGLSLESRLSELESKPEGLHYRWQPN